MKFCIIALFALALAGCGGNTRPQIVIPPDADLKTDVMFQGTGPDRTIEISFYFSKPVAPGVKTEPTLEVIPVDDVTFNGTPLPESVNAVGRTIYTGKGLSIKAENVIAAKLNGRQYEGRIIPQTTLPNRSTTAVMTPK